MNIIPGQPKKEENNKKLTHFPPNLAQGKKGQQKGSKIF